MADFSFQDKTVVFIINVCALAGAERQALGLAGFLKERFNCKIHFIAVHSNMQTEEFKKFAKYCGIDKIENYGVPALSIKKDFSFKNLKKAIRAIKYLNKVKSEVKKMKPDVIIPYMNSASKLANLIYKDVGAKYTFWHELGESGNLHFDLLEKKAIKQTPFFCANANDGFNVFIDRYDILKKDCYLLTQYVSFKKVDYDNVKVRKELNIPVDKLIYGMIAHFRDQKHPELLMEAFSKMENNRNVHLLFLGNKNNNDSTINKYKINV